MHAIIDRTICGRRYNGCQTCFARFLQNPRDSKRPCFASLQDDGSETLTIELRTEGHTVQFVLDEEEREEMAQEAFMAYAGVVFTRYREMQNG